MARVWLVHWQKEEGQEHARLLKQAGHSVLLHWSTEVTMKTPEVLPDAVVISLDRLPSHGRAIAEYFLEAKKRRHVPVIFAGGKPDKVEATRAKFPGAVYCSFEKLPDALRQAIR